MSEWRRSPYVISTDIEKIDVDVVHGFLSSAYWSRGVPRSIIQQAMHGSLCFGVYRDDQQVGFARVVSDQATFAWLADVFVLPTEQGAGLGTWLMEVVMSHPDLQGLRRWMLATQDAHELYRRFGFTDLVQPERYMEIVKPDLYLHGEDYYQ